MTGGFGNRCWHCYALGYCLNNFLVGVVGYVELCLITWAWRIVNGVDAEGNVLPCHLATTHVFIELDHEFHSSFEFDSTDDGDFCLVEDFIGFQAALTGY